MKNKLEDLRNHLFAALEGLADDEKPMEIERARAIGDLAQTAINIGKLEVEFMKVNGQAPLGGFLQEALDTESKARPKRLAQQG